MMSSAARLAQHLSFERLHFAATAASQPRLGRQSGRVTAAREADDNKWLMNTLERIKRSQWPADSRDESVAQLAAVSPGEPSKQVALAAVSAATPATTHLRRQRRRHCNGSDPLQVSRSPDGRATAANRCS